MFKYSIDKKSEITDSYGNVLIDLTNSIFSKYSTNLNNFQVKYVTKLYNMRPDLVSIGEYGTDENTEFILKYSGISNPFSFGENDIIIIPEITEVEQQLKVNTPIEHDDEKTKETEVLIKNFFKFHNSYKKDHTTYNALNNLNIPSGNLDNLETKNKDNYNVPYISEDGETAITIKNGKMYFGTNSGVKTAGIDNVEDLDNKIKSIVNNTATALSDTNCLSNGINLSTFVRSSLKSQN